MAEVVVVLPLFLFSTILIVVLSSLLLRFARRTRRRSSGSGGNNGLPPSPPGQLPMVGHLHLLVLASHPPHVSLRDIADRYGSDGLVLLRLGQVPTLVVSSPRAAEAVLRAQDHAFASRPPSASADILVGTGAGGTYGVALAPYGDYWRQARKLVSAHLLSAGKVHSLRRVREGEVRRALAGVGAAAGAAVDVGEVVGAFVNGVVCAAVSGRLLFRPGGRNCREMFRELILDNSTLLGGFNIRDYFPSLLLGNKLDVLVTWMICARTMRLKKRWDVLLDQIIDEHAVAKSLEDHGNNNQQEDTRDFIDVLLSLQQEYCLTRDQVKAILMDMFVAGTDTSSIALEYAMAELVKNPHVMTKLQAEIANNTPKGQEMVKEEDLNNMTYLKAVVKETLRLHPPTPLLLPRISMENCNVNEYAIPAGTRVIVNAWALGRDPKSWEKADEFMPERFISSGGNASFVDYKGRDFKFLPFGAGRRICPGISFGVAIIEIMLANLLYCFDWDLSTGLNKEDIDMTEVFGLTVRLKHKLLLVPRSLRNLDRTYTRTTVCKDRTRDA